MNSKENSLLLMYLIFDIILLNMAVWGVYVLDIGDIHNKGNCQTYMLQASFAWIITYVVLTKHNLYLRDSFLHRIFRICKRIAWFILILTAISFVFGKGENSRAFIFSYVIFFALGEMVIYRFAYLIIEDNRRRNDRYSKRILLVGYNNTSNLFRKMVENTPMLGYKFVGYLKHDVRDIEEIPHYDRNCILGNISNLEQVIKQHNIHAVFSEYSFFHNRTDVSWLLNVCNSAGVRMYLVAENRRWFKEISNVESIGDFNVINPQHIPLDDFTNRLAKRVFDIIFSAVIVIVGSVTLLPLVAIIIKCTSRGPVFFVQYRTGLNNRQFRCYKFRTMRLNNDCDTLQATKGDERITPIGRFMRKMNIDELPQFWNVLCGHMSVVGPRPHMLKHTEQYSELIKHYCIRHYVKPGISGWAQVNGWRGATKEVSEMEERVKYDMEYIENWSFMWDLQIIWLTIFGQNARINAY